MEMRYELIYMFTTIGNAKFSKKKKHIKIEINYGAFSSLFFVLEYSYEEVLEFFTDLEKSYKRMLLDEYEPIGYLFYASYFVECAEENNYDHHTQLMIFATSKITEWKTVK